MVGVEFMDTHLLPRQHLPILLIMLSDTDKRLAFECGDCHAAETATEFPVGVAFFVDWAGPLVEGLDFLVAGLASMSEPGLSLMKSSDLVREEKEEAAATRLRGSMVVVKVRTCVETFKDINCGFKR